MKCTSLYATPLSSLCVAGRLKVADSSAHVSELNDNTLGESAHIN